MLNKTSAFFILPALFAATAISPFSCSVARDGGTWRSDDFGANFKQIATIEKNKTVGSRNVLSLEIEPLNPNVLYIGTDGDGLYKSLDSGGLWQKKEDRNNILDKRASVYDIAVSRKNPNLVYLATVSSGLGTVFKSSDAGESFKAIYVISNTNQRINDIELDNVNEAVLYIATSEGGLLKSLDQGQSWQAVKWFDNKVFLVNVDPKNSQIIYVNVENKGLFKSADGGQNFQILDVKQPEESAGFYNFSGSEGVNNLLIDLFDSKVLYVSKNNKIFISADAGGSWRIANILLPPESLPISAMAQDSKNSSNFYYSAGSVIYRSLNAFRSWSTYQILSSRRINLIKIDPLDTNIVYVGMSE